MADYRTWTDEELTQALNIAIRKHDHLIDRTDIGDERVYRQQCRINAIRKEQQRRSSK